jgi:hypothetical protein
VRPGRRIEIAFKGERLLVSYEQCLEESVLRIREQELVRKLRRELAALGEVAPAGPGVLAVDGAAPVPMLKTMRRIDRAIEEIASRPFTPRMVVEILGITSRERIRWTKNGRLQRSGSATFKGGRTVTFCTYAAGEIARLAANPTIIEGWRRADEEC